MIANKLSGSVTFVEMKKLEDGTNYRVVKVLQVNDQGDAHTVPVTVWDESVKVEVGKAVEFQNVDISVYKSKSGNAGLKVSLAKKRV